jgi:tetratricopeptide (TPR) repeat protein
MMKCRFPARGFVASIFICGAAWAWGPATQQAITTTAAHVISNNGVARLAKLEKDVRDGASASPETIAKLYPGYAQDPVRFIESEMYLLDSVRNDIIDPYYAYRLGMLGRLTAALTAPLINADRSVRDKYYADVEKYMTQVPLKPGARRLVDPAPYFERARRAADARKDLLVKDYQDGVGFDGIAKATVAEELSRSVDAVADVWNTILTQNVVHANVSDEQIRGYVVAAMEFYVKRNNSAEIDASYRRLSGIVKKTPDFLKKIGDLFYGGGVYERAISIYQEVLQMDPQRRDVVARIADYYVKQGDESVKAKRLQEASDFFAKAVQTDPLHPEAERKRLDCEAQIADRDARLESAKRAIEEAAQFQTDAEQLVMRSKYSEAMSSLQQAQSAYETVTDEFPTEARAANIGLQNVSARLGELKGELTRNAQSLSGVGFLPDMQRLAGSAANELDDQGLRAILKNQFDAHMSKLKAQYQDKFSISAQAPQNK